MSCPYLDYRTTAGDAEFERERPYCTIAEAFVSPMKADICNARHDFDYATHCDVYRRTTGSERPRDVQERSDD